MWFHDSNQLTLFEAMSDNSISSDSLPSITVSNQTNKHTVFKLREEDHLDLLQTSLPHLMDNGIKVEFNRNRSFYVELGGLAE